MNDDAIEKLCLMGIAAMLTVAYCSNVDPPSTREEIRESFQGIFAEVKYFYEEKD